MSYTSPATAVAGSVLTAAWLNTYVRDNISYLKADPSVNTLTVTGGGIVFPLVQVASGSANVLDDYEEGTFTPTLVFGGAAVGMTTSVAEGSYVKKGQDVQIQLRIVLSAKGSSTGDATIGGLPFQSTAAVTYGGVAFTYFDNLGVSVSALMAYIGSVVTVLNLVYVPAAGAASVINMSDVAFTDTTTLILAGSYRSVS